MQLIHSYTASYIYAVNVTYINCLVKHSGIELMSVVLSQILYISLLVQASLESCTFNGDAVNPGTVIISVNIILYSIAQIINS